MHDDVAAQAVAGEVDDFVGSETIEQCFEIGDVIGKPVALRLPLRPAETAQVRRHDEPVAHQRVDQELERRADVHPTMQQDELRRGGLAPRQHMMAHAAQLDELRA